jgi:hypothetical protein
MFSLLLVSCSLAFCSLQVKGFVNSKSDSWSLIILKNIYDEFSYGAATSR